MPTGAVTAVRTNKEDEYAFCFIKCAEEKGKIFCHVSTLQGVDDPAATIKKGVYLTFDISKDEQGRIAAQNAKIASDADKAKAESDIAAATAAARGGGGGGGGDKPKRNRRAKKGAAADKSEGESKPKAKAKKAKKAPAAPAPLATGTGLLGSAAISKKQQDEGKISYIFITPLTATAARKRGGASGGLSRYAAPEDLSTVPDAVKDALLKDRKCFVQFDAAPQEASPDRPLASNLTIAPADAVAEAQSKAAEARKERASAGGRGRGSNLDQVDELIKTKIETASLYLLEESRKTQEERGWLTVKVFRKLVVARVNDPDVMGALVEVEREKAKVLTTSDYVAIATRSGAWHVPPKGKPDPKSRKRPAATIEPFEGDVEEKADANVDELDAFASGGEGDY